MSNPIALISDSGDILFSMYTVMDTGEECIFMNKEFSEEKYVIFRTTGSFKYVLENKTDFPASFVLEDEQGKIVSTNDCLGPYSKFSIHHHSENHNLLTFDKDKLFKFTINFVGIWKLSDKIDDIKVTYDPRGGSSSIKFSHLLQTDIKFLTYEPIKETKQTYLEDNCCICLGEKKNSLCTLIKCGHKCVHLDCFFDGETPNFKNCPLCRSNIIAISN
jgi:hypothetical protein